MAHFQDIASCPYPHPLFRIGSLLRPTLFLTVIALFAGIGTAQAQNAQTVQKHKAQTAGTAPAAPTQDGRAILLKTLQLYQSLNSYSGQANVDTMMLSPTNQTIKHIGSSSVMKLQRPNKIYLYFQTPIGSRRIYSDGVNFSVYDETPNQYLTVPAPADMPGLLKVLLARADVAAGLDPLYFLTQNSLPKELSKIKLKGTATYNGHPVYIVTGMTNSAPVVTKSGKTLTPVPTSYWTWWIDRTSSLLYKIETMTPNITKPVSFGSGAQRTVQNVKGTLILRHTVSELKPDANVAPSEFSFTPPKAATRKQMAQDVLDNKRK
jgi:outer membrane lipoprotein-sorting protein